VQRVDAETAAMYGMGINGCQNDDGNTAKHEELEKVINKL